MSGDDQPSFLCGAGVPHHHQVTALRGKAGPDTNNEQTRVRKGGTTALTDTTISNQKINAGTRDTLASTCRLKVSIIMESCETCARNCTMLGTTTYHKMNYRIKRN